MHASYFAFMLHDMFVSMYQQEILQHVLLQQWHNSGKIVNPPCAALFFDSFITQVLTSTRKTFTRLCNFGFSPHIANTCEAPPIVLTVPHDIGTVLNLQIQYWWCQEIRQSVKCISPSLFPAIQYVSPQTVFAPF